jgi:hypothetical protein
MLVGAVADEDVPAVVLGDDPHPPTARAAAASAASVSRANIAHIVQRARMTAHHPQGVRLR